MFSPFSALEKPGATKYVRCVLREFQEDSTYMQQYSTQRLQMGKPLNWNSRLACTVLLASCVSYLTAIVVQNSQHTGRCSFCRPLLGFDHPYHASLRHFNVSGYQSLPALLEAHRSWQLQRLDMMLRNKHAGVADLSHHLAPVVLVKLPSNGFGNRLPSVVTGGLELSAGLHAQLSVPNKAPGLQTLSGKGSVRVVYKTQTCLLLDVCQNTWQA